MSERRRRRGRAVRDPHPRSPGNPLGCLVRRADLTNDSDGTTVISGLVADQSALHGLLHKVRDVGLPLVSVTRVDQSGSSRPQPPLDNKENDMSTTV